MTGDAQVVTSPNFHGLTAKQVRQRHEAGQSNEVDTGTSRSVKDILRANLFTVFNGILGTAALAVILLGDWRDAVFGIVLVMNLAIGVFTELRSKRTLDALAVLQAPTSRVVRDGEVETVPNEDLVIDDVLQLKLGDQVPADGEVLASSGLEVDESALTGESKPVHKKVGDKLLSGTSVVGGTGVMVVQVIGADSWAQKITREAKKFSKARSEIQESIDKVLRVITLLLPVITLILLWSQLRVDDGDWRGAVVLTVAGIVGMIPQGLVLLTSLNFGIASASLARKNVLVQELPAVEILARVDVLCLDKTGTITTGDIRGRSLVFNPKAEAGPSGATPSGAGEDCTGSPKAVSLSVLSQLVSDETNATANAVAGLVREACEAECGEGDGADAQDAGSALAPIAKGTLLPFNSVRKWSAVNFPEDQAPFGGYVTWILGAPEIVVGGQAEGAQWAEEVVKESSSKGRRTVALVATRQPLEGETLPEGRVPVAVAVLEEDVRPDAAETLDYFEKQGVTIKIISGDSQKTVGAIAQEVGLRHGADGEADVVVTDARTLPEIGSPQFREEALETDVFGRVTPEQKRGLVHALQDSGYTVAMTGDGVNDALALKDADLGIAMGNGAPATKAVSRLVLVDGKFSVLPGVVADGRRIIANMERVSSLFLSKTTYAMLLAVVVALAGWAYPFLPRHLTYISTFTIGVPGFFLSLAPNTRKYRPGFLRRTLLIAVPSGIILAVSALTAYGLTGTGTLQGHTAATLTLIIGAMALLIILAKPWNTWRVTLVVAMITGAILGILVPFVRNFFALELPDASLWVLVIVAGGVAALLIVASYVFTARWRNTAVPFKHERVKEKTDATH